MALRTKMTARFITFLVCSILVVASVILSYRAYRTSLKTSQKVVARVGPHAITVAQVQYQKTLDSFTAKELWRKDLSLHYVKQTFGYQVLLANHGEIVGHAELAKERMRIANEKRHQRLQKLARDIQGFDPRFYEGIFIRGILVRRLIKEKLLPVYQKQNSTITFKEWLELELTKLEEKSSPSDI